ncbi:MAG: hypothetical protein ACR2JC_13405 [Chloroflexota bacterium]|nr:MAG: hypothetical protein DLM70_15095 [Chloroflexota bacterium]
MYALVSLWQLSDAYSGELMLQLEHPIVPFVRQSPGFVEGYWTHERSNGKSFGFMLLDAAEHAYDLKDAIESHMEGQDHPRAQLEMIRVQEIVAHEPGVTPEPPLKQ